MDSVGEVFAVRGIDLVFDLHLHDRFHVGDLKEDGFFVVGDFHAGHFCSVAALTTVGLVVA